MQITEYIKNHIVYLDGGMGTLLQENGLKPGEYPEKWNISHPEVIRRIHTDYFNAGSNIVCTNTFGANLLKFSFEELEAIIAAAVENARTAAENSFGNHEKFIALDIGPCGKLLKPYGDFDFEEAVSLFAETVELGEKYGADLIFLETFSDSYETKAALLAAKENSRLPVFVSNAYGEDGKLMTGASPEVMSAMLEGMHADAVGANCSVGPDKLHDVVNRLIACSSVPVIVKPNAGLPQSIGGKTMYDILPKKFAETMKEFVSAGALLVGGCCGTTPEYISLLHDETEKMVPASISEKERTVISSYTKTVSMGEKPVLIGERINPTGKKRFKQALIENDITYILKEGISQQERGVDVLDVNVGIPDINERDMLISAVTQLQTVCDLPLQIDTSSPEAMESALRRYNGKAMINSVNGKEESMKAVFPLVRKYGGVVVALTLDESGIPADAAGRVRIAEKIISRAAEYGISKKDIVFDTLAMSVAADARAPVITLEALKKIKKEFGCHTSLGISNVSFGLPSRDAINSAFFVSALENGLSAAIMNPYSDDMLKTYYSYLALHGLDDNCNGYIEFMASLPAQAVAAPASKPSAAVSGENKSFSSELQKAIVSGMRDDASAITAELLKEKKPLDIVSEEIIPALDIVGKGYENKTVYLPQLLMSAEASKSSFECIKKYFDGKKDALALAPKCNFVIATVHGDIHDIGKNIVKLLLENYGFTVYDLGKDVPPEKIVDEVLKIHSPIVGLSALMTTTVPAMEKTIKYLKKSAPWCKIVVGGAVMTKEYAEKIGADKYARDAMDTVRYAEEISAAQK